MLETEEIESKKHYSKHHNKGEISKDKQILFLIEHDNDKQQTHRNVEENNLPGAIENLIKDAKKISEHLNLRRQKENAENDHSSNNTQMIDQATQENAGNKTQSPASDENDLQLHVNHNTESLSDADEISGNSFQPVKNDNVVYDSATSNSNDSVVAFIDLNNNSKLLNSNLNENDLFDTLKFRRNKTITSENVVTDQQNKVDSLIKEENALDHQIYVLKKALRDYHRASQLKTDALKELSKLPLVLISDQQNKLNDTQYKLKEEIELSSVNTKNVSKNKNNMSQFPNTPTEQMKNNENLKSLEALINLSGENGNRSLLKHQKPSQTQHYPPTRKEELVFEKANKRTIRGRKPTTVMKLLLTNKGSVQKRT